MAENSASNIQMTHPRLAGADPVPTTRDALTKVWAKKGWVEYNPNKQSSTPQTPPARVSASQANSQSSANAGSKGA